MSDLPPIATVMAESDAERSSKRRSRQWVPVSPSTRVAWGVIATAMAAVLVTAAILTPAKEGMGTHEALGLPPCSLVVTSGLPCPTCGMTTSFAHAMRGQFISAFIAQPMGLMLWVGTWLIAIYGTSVAVRGKGLWINWDRLAPRLMLTLGICMMLGWGFKIAWGMATGTINLN